MKIAYIHVLPLEYYPPAVNTLELLADQSGWDVHAWTTKNERGAREWTSSRVDVRRPSYPASSAWLPGRIAGYLKWHFHTAREVERLAPDIVISVEPHSALATWLYYKVFRGRARLFIHHHEYYAPEDFTAAGMRQLRRTQSLERADLFQRAEWISQTNGDRLKLLQEWNAAAMQSGNVFPNYPREAWVRRAANARHARTDRPVRFLYLGSASSEDTFILEISRWIASHSGDASLVVTGNNVSADVWTKLIDLNAPNISLNESGWEYDALPEELKKFDVGLVLYRGNTKNFIYNIPNKAIEYLAAGLEVWFPPQMRAMADFARAHPELRMKQVNFDGLPAEIPAISSASDRAGSFPFTAESAIAPMLAAIRQKS